MSSFTAALVTTWEDDGTWTVRGGFRYYIGAEESGAFVEVPDGYHTDLTSFPFIVRQIMSGVGREAPAAAVHDVLYKTGRISVELEDPDAPGRMLATTVPIIRPLADGIMLEAMCVKNVSPIRREAIYRGLQIGGGPAWRNHARTRASTAPETHT